jgi:hypothetical protein
MDWSRQSAQGLVKAYACIRSFLSR